MIEYFFDTFYYNVRQQVVLIKIEDERRISRLNRKNEWIHYFVDRVDIVHNRRYIVHNRRYQPITEEEADKYLVIQELSK